LEKSPRKGTRILSARATHRTLEVVDISIPKQGVSVKYSDTTVEISLPLSSAESLLYALRDLELIRKRVDI
jgi:hypothetical protein